MDMLWRIRRARSIRFLSDLRNLSLGVRDFANRLRFDQLVQFAKFHRFAKRTFNFGSLAIIY